MNSSLLILLFASLLRSAGLNDLAGEYFLASDEVLHVFGAGDRLCIRFAGHGQVPLHAEAPDIFRHDVIEGRVSFVRGPSGRVDHLILHDNRERRAARASDHPVAPESEVRPVNLSEHVGRYLFPDGTWMHIALEGDRQLYARLPNRPWLAIYPESELVYYFKTMDAQLVFEQKGDRRRSRGETVRIMQNGVELRARGPLVTKDRIIDW